MDPKQPQKNKKKSTQPNKPTKPTINIPSEPSNKIRKKNPEKVTSKRNTVRRLDSNRLHRRVAFFMLSGSVVPELR